MSRPGRVALLLLVGMLATACAGWDAAALVEPGTDLVTASPGDLRVLRYHDDPGAGDAWIDVATPDATVVAADGAFRESGSRTAPPDEPADVRLLYEAVAPGRTLLVQLNCRACDGDGVPGTALADTGIHVWEFVVGDAADEPLVLDRTVARPGEEHVASVGDHVVVVREPGAPDAITAPAAVLVHVARHAPGGGADLVVDVFAAVAPGRATITYGTDDHPVRVEPGVG